MKSLFILSCFLSFFFFSSAKNDKNDDKVNSSSCQNPIYIISTLDYTFLDLTAIKTCTVYGATAHVFLTRAMPSWCFMQDSSALVYNGRKNSKNHCAVSLYGDEYGNFEALFPRAMMNPNWLKWEFKALGDGLSAIYSLGPHGTNEDWALTWNGTGISLARYKEKNVGQKWLIANAYN